MPVAMEASRQEAMIVLMIVVVVMDVYVVMIELQVRIFVSE